MSSGRLADLIAGLPFTEDREQVIAELESAIGDVQRAIGEMRADRGRIHHYGG